MDQRLAVWNSLPLTELKLVQTANQVLCKHLQRLMQHITVHVQICFTKIGPPLAFDNDC